MKRKAGRVDRNDVKARAAAMRQKKAAAEAAKQKAKRRTVKRQWVLTVGRRAGGSVLELCEGLILFQALRQVLGGLSIQVIVPQTASMKQNPTSGGPDSTDNTEAAKKDVRCSKSPQ